MRFLMFTRCKGGKCRRVCLWGIMAWLGLPLEHGLWEWTGMARFLPLVGLHI